MCSTGDGPCLGSRLPNQPYRWISYREVSGHHLISSLYHLLFAAWGWVVWSVLQYKCRWLPHCDATDDVINNEAKIWMLSFKKKKKPQMFCCTIVSAFLFRKWPRIGWKCVGFHNSTSGKFGFQHLQVLTNPSVSGSNCNRVGGVGSHCGEKCSKPCDLHKRQYLSVSPGWRKTKGWQVEVSKLICHIFLNQLVKIICRVSGKHARADLFYTSNISEMSFSMAIIWHKRSKTSSFFTDYRITELQN